MRYLNTIWLRIGSSILLPSTRCYGFRLFNNGALTNDESSFHQFLRGKRKVEEKSANEDENGTLTASLTIQAQSSYPLQHHSGWIDLEVVVLSGHCDSQLSILTVCTQSNENVFVSKTLLSIEPEKTSDDVIDIAEHHRGKRTHSIVQFNSGDDTAARSVGDRRFMVTKDWNRAEIALCQARLECAAANEESRKNISTPTHTLDSVMFLMEGGDRDEDPLIITM